MRTAWENYAKAARSTTNVNRTGAALRTPFNEADVQATSRRRELSDVARIWNRIGRCTDCRVQVTFRIPPERRTTLPLPTSNVRVADNPGLGK